VEALDDVPGERRQGRVGQRGVGLSGNRRELLFELGQQAIGRQALRLAGLAERPLAAATEVDAGAVEDAAGGGIAGDDLADGGGQVECAQVGVLSAPFAGALLFAAGQRSSAARQRA
jgi:hypothetical protein